MGPDFFIGRAGQDSEVAKHIALILEDAGRRVLIQDWDFTNRSYLERMYSAFKSGARTIALLSPDYLANDHCAAEWQNAVAELGFSLTLSQLNLPQVAACAASD